MADLLDRVRTVVADRYQVERELGRGGMAAVFLAEDLKHRRPVALKVLLPELAAALGPERFLREVETTARLTHPHILPLHDSGAAGGLLYYVMPYAEGESLRDRLRREKQLPLDEAIRIAREVAEALEHAHSRSLIHRDIKPENILLSGGHAVLSDFGIARAVREAGGAKLTESGAVLGTPSYMSPEQATGSDVLDARSDLYSLGCVLYEMLAGQPPFTGPTGESVLHQHLTATPHSVTTIRPSVPAAVAQALQRALAKTPADRFGTVRQFAEALESALRAPPGERPRREGLRRLFLAAAVLALLAAGALAAWKLRPDLFRVRPAPEAGRKSWILVAEFDAPPDDPELAMAARDLVSVALDQSGTVATVSGDQLRVALQMAGKPPTAQVGAALARELAFRSRVRAVLEGRISRLGAGYALALRVVNPEEGRTLLSLSEVAEDSEGLVQAIARAGRKLREGLGEHRGQIASGRKLAEIATPSLAAFRKFAQAGESMKNADFRAGRHAALEALAIDPDFAMAWYALGLALGNLGKTDSAEAAMKEALKRPQRLTDSQLRSIEVSLALNHGDLPAAMAALERRLEQDPENAGALMNLGVVLDAAGHQEEALRCFERAARASPFGPAPILRLNQFLVLQALGRMDEARDVASKLKGDSRHEAALLLMLREEAWARAESLAVALEEDPTSSGEVRLYAALARASVHAARGAVGAAHRALGAARAAGALHVAARARALLALVSGTRVPPPDAALVHDSSVRGLTTRGFLAATAGDTSLARRLLSALRSRSANETMKPGGGPLVIEALIAARGGHWEEAARLLGPAARQGFEPGLGVDGIGRATMRWVVADAFERLGLLDSAAVFFESALSPRGMSAAEVYHLGIHHSFARGRLALLYARLGRPEEARRHGRIFGDTFTHPDPGMRPLLDEVRQVAGPGSAAPSEPAEMGLRLSPTL